MTNLENPIRPILKIFSLLILMFILNTSDGQLIGGEKTMEEFLDRLLHHSVYDRRIRPFYKTSKENKPVEIKMTMHINTLSAINEVQMVRLINDTSFI
jgi:hypothetical protein